MKKPRLYFLLAKQAKLAPLSGDRINEMGLVRALSRSFDVYYNGVHASESDAEFGRDDNVISIPSEGEYDLVYIRANREVFLAAPHPKIWFASPYDKECFDQADAIACMTRPWRDRLANYSASDFDYFDQMYPEDMSAPVRCLLVPQVIKRLPSNAELTELRSVEVTVEASRPSGLSGLLERFSTVFQSSEKRTVIRHFGPIRASNFPHQLVHSLKTDTGLRKRMVAECIGAGDKMNLPDVVVKLPRIPQEDALALLAQSHAIWYNQHRSGNFAGSLKVLEAMAMGVPVLAPSWDARRYEMGHDYPFFWTPDSAADFEKVEQSAFREALENVLLIGDAERLQLGERLRERVSEFTVDSVGKFLSDEFGGFLNTR